MFDPYRKWLGIQPKDQPPNHYRLLSVDLFENDLDVIEGAADRTMGFVRQYQSGEYAADAARILNEIAAVRLCLLKPDKKAAYDQKLRKEIAAAAPAETKEVSAESTFADMPLTEADLKPLAKITPRKKKPARKPISIPVNLQYVGAALAIGLVLIAFLPYGAKLPSMVNQSAPVSQVDVPVSAAPPVPVKTATEIASIEPVRPDRTGSDAVLPEKQADSAQAGTPTPGSIGNSSKPMANADSKTASPKESAPTRGTAVVRPQLVRTFQGLLGASPTGVFTKDSKRMVYVTGSDVVVVDTETGEDVEKYSGHKQLVQIARFSPDESRIVSISPGETIRVWDTEEHKQTTMIKEKTTGQGEVLSISENADKIAYASVGNRRLTLMNLVKKSEIRHIDLTESQVQWRSVANDWKWAMSNGIRNQVTFWKLDDQTTYQIDNGHHNSCGQFSPDGTMALLAGHSSWDFWEFETKYCTLSGQIASGHIYAIGYHPDWDRFLTGHSDGTIALWDATSGKKLLQFVGDTRPINFIILSPDKKFALIQDQPVVIQDQSAMIRLWRFPD